jgi:hypothetical protein
MFVVANSKTRIDVNPNCHPLASRLCFFSLSSRLRD